MACLGHHIHVADKFLALTDGQVEGSHLLAVERSHVLHHLPEGGIVHVHVGDIDKSGQLVFLAQFPRPLSSHFNAGFTVYHNDGRSRRTQSLLGLAHEIKVARCIYHINLAAFPFNRDHGGADGEFAFLFFFAVVAYGIAVRHLAHSGCDAGQVRKCFRQTGLAAAAMPQKNHIAYLVSCVDFHLTFLHLLCNLGTFDTIMTNDFHPM